MKRCSICGKSFSGFGNNPEPIKRWIEGSCCDDCNREKVLPTRKSQAEKEMP